MTPSKGTLFYITKVAGQVAASPTALPAAALALSDIDDTPYGTGTSGDWTQLVCVMDVGGLDDLMNETQEHRCLDSTKILVEQVATGYIVPGAVTLKIEYATNAMTYFRAAKLANTKLRLMAVLPFSDTQTVAGDKFAWKVRCQKATPVFDVGGKPIELDLEFNLFDDTGVFTAGS